MSKYTLEIFNSHNTARKCDITTDKKMIAILQALDTSRRSLFPVIIYDNDTGAFIKYDNGERVEWSITNF